MVVNARGEAKLGVIKHRKSLTGELWKPEMPSCHSVALLLFPRSAKHADFSRCRHQMEVSIKSNTAVLKTIICSPDVDLCSIQRRQAEINRTGIHGSGGTIQLSTGEKGRSAVRTGREEEVLSLNVNSKIFTFYLYPADTFIRNSLNQ